MSLEKDIHQKSFKNEYQKAMLNIIYTHNWLNQQHNGYFDAEEITQQQYNVLRIIRGAGKPISTSQIRQSMLDKMSDSSRIVERLALKGLVKKAASVMDKRLVDVSITAKGKVLLAKFDELEPKFFEALHNLTEAEAKTVNKLLEKLRG
jgi:DNA-binding MarR family transcriptional regulator